MQRTNGDRFLALVMAGGFLGICGCTPEKPADPAKTTTSADSANGTAIVKVEPGVAGGSVEQTFSADAKVTAIDASNRNITLTNSAGEKGTFTAGPEIRNFDQLRVGDTVTATVTEKLTVFVRRGSEDPTATHAAALASAPKGAKPGALIAEAFEIVAKVQSIDNQSREAKVQLVDGQTRTITVRPDVDLSKYKVGDNVVMRVSQMITVVAKNTKS